MSQHLQDHLTPRVGLGSTAYVRSATTDGRVYIPITIRNIKERSKEVLIDLAWLSRQLGPAEHKTLVALLRSLFCVCCPLRGSAIT